MPASVSPRPVIKYQFADAAVRSAHVVTQSDIALGGSIAFQTDIQRYFIAFRTGTGNDRWRQIDTESLLTNVVVKEDQTAVFADGFKEAVFLGLPAIDRTVFVQGTMIQTIDNVGSKASMRLIETTTNTVLNNRDPTFKPTSTDEILTPFVSASLVLSTSDSPPQRVALQYAVIQGGGELTVSDAHVQFQLAIYPPGP